MFAAAIIVCIGVTLVAVYLSQTPSLYIDTIRYDRIYHIESSN
jgi:hypothetical protein